MGIPKSVFADLLREKESGFHRGNHNSGLA
jgi:hypothetical protein